jgi:hypothetical protein
MRMQHEVRVRVRPEFAARYPELAPGVWVSAREFAHVIVTRARQARHYSIHRRTLDPRHFDFGGAGVEAPRLPAARLYARVKPQPELAH